MFELWSYCIVICGVLQSTVPAFELNFDNPLIAHRGLGWPHDLHVTENHEALMKLIIDLDNQNSCVLTTPVGAKFDISTPPSDRYESWGDGCGVRLKTVMKGDEGRWRLTASNASESITGWTELYVIEEPPTNYSTPIWLQDGKTNVQVNLSNIHNLYCLVAKPFEESSLVSGDCKVTLPRITRAVQGTWSVVLGLPGKVNEVQLSRRVVVEGERLHVGYTHESDTNKLNLYCNILHSDKNITFCRFQRTPQTNGFNVVDGLSDGSHSYYGDGFALRHCGMTIEHPTQDDYGTWRCSVGVEFVADNHVEHLPPLQALISVAPRVSMRRRRDLHEESKAVFIQEGGTLNLMCHADVSLMYCWFQHPNGSQFTPTQLLNEHQPFWYTGAGLDTGECGISFAHVTRNDSGSWTCHMGPRGHSGIEAIEDIEVRVTGSLAANKIKLNVHVGAELTLYCHTSNGNRPLDYCRFLSPTFLGLNIDSSITQENAILNRFYFTPGRSIDYGDCSLTISSIQEEDIGQWTCAAKLADEVMEARDTIMVKANTINSSIMSRRSQKPPLSPCGLSDMGALPLKTEKTTYFF
ncbi:unnamed protein product [Leptidea sinapis]|uniref:Ig-like domain-containing protein n=1 Tax=Leptidea sinapis TaxID=189913 RepID=A0A5E4Q049_9NEOP|nr:unnamed protein product [Leptidea sinapis]